MPGVLADILNGIMWVIIAATTVVAIVVVIAFYVALYLVIMAE